jgi:hypothetical protein
MVAHESINAGRHRAYPAGPAYPARRAALVGSAAAITTVWIAVTLTAPHVRVSTPVLDVALFVHLAGVVLGFGAVLTVDWFGLLWALRLKPLTSLLQVAGGVDVLIWLGLATLMGSGLLLHPDTSVVRVQVKLVAVLVVAVNGLLAGRLHRRMSGVPADQPSTRLLVAGGVLTLISQAGWWTATFIGFLSALK